VALKLAGSAVPELIHDLGVRAMVPRSGGQASTPLAALLGGKR
jgi:hypothetical protein